MFEPVTLKNPFVGLRAFNEDEDDIFFGRDKEISDLILKFSKSTFLAVIGSSGSGKSSLVKSGLLPAIHSGFLSPGGNWHVASFRPGNDPIGEMTRAMARENILYNNISEEKTSPKAIIYSTLKRSSLGLVQAYNQAFNKPGLKKTEKLLIVVDQFEEIFRFRKYEMQKQDVSSDSKHFIELLLTAAQQDECPIYILITMRSDFIGDCAEFRGLPEAINAGQYLVPRMTRDEIREAITGPIAVGDGTITPRLVTRLLNDIENDIDQLPIMQHAMMRTWDAWTKRKKNQPGLSNDIDFVDYDKIGTMKSALSEHADEAYGELAEGRDQDICKLIFKALTDKSADVRGIRRPRTVNDLCLLTGGTKEEITKEVEIFQRTGRTFLMPPPGTELTGRTIIDISHESLMRIWVKLKQWADDEARSGEIYMRLANSAALYKLGDKGLLEDPELKIALDWKTNNDPTAIWAEGYKADFKQAIDYLVDSQKEDLEKKRLVAEREAEEKRRRRRRVMNAIILLSLFGVTATGLFINSTFANKEAKKQQEIALKANIQLKATADSLHLSDSTVKEKNNNLTNLNKNLDIAYKKTDTLNKTLSAKDTLLEKQNLKLKNDSALINSKNVALKNVIKDLDSSNKEIHQQILKTAASEYARLIQDGPSEENGNENTFYTVPDNYFLAYSYYFNRLNDSLLNNYTAYRIYKSIKNKLYYDNELYQRIYEDFEKIGPAALQEVIKPVDKSEIDFNSIKNSIGPTVPAGYVSSAKSSNGKLHFYSTDDNFIYVFNDSSKSTDTIYMGAKVTALDFNDESSIIYFGTSSGYIGYIEYAGGKKNQPVFENKLESQITAIENFDYKDNPDSINKNNPDSINHFLLATAKTSNATLYKLDGNLKPDKLLIGNELPYKKEYGNINGAVFYKDKGKIILNTSKGTFLWNPFSYDLFEKLQVAGKFAPSDSKYKEIKFY